MVYQVKKLEERLHECQQQQEAKIHMYEKQVQTYVAELADVRARVTDIAELFERKPITQQYSFEVLCDFVIDKAKRLFSKYESLSKDRKQVGEEQRYYFTKRIDQLEAQVSAGAPKVAFADRILDFVVPRLADLIEETIKKREDAEEYGYQVIEQVEHEFRIAKKSNNLLKERVNELGRQLDVQRQRHESASYAERSTTIEEELK